MKFIECSNTAAQSAEIERREVVQSNLVPRLVLLTSQQPGSFYCRDHSRRPSELLTPLTSREINNTAAWTLFNTASALRNLNPRPYVDRAACVSRNTNSNIANTKIRRSESQRVKCSPHFVRRQTYKEIVKMSYHCDVTSSKRTWRKAAGGTWPLLQIACQSGACE